MKSEKKISKFSPRGIWGIGENSGYIASIFIFISFPCRLTIGEENVLSWEKFPWSALSKTYNTDQQVADSAGTATAFMTGVKARAGKLVINLFETNVLMRWP